MLADRPDAGGFDALMSGRGAYAVDAPVDVVLVDMPFAPLHRPSFSLGLATAILRREGHRVASFAFGIPWAEHLGRDAYVEVANQQPQATDLLGEWIFGGALFGRDPVAERAYVEGILRRRDPFYAEPSRHLPAVSEALTARAVACRAAAPSFVAACAAAVTRRRPRVVVCTSVFQQHVASLALARHVKALTPEAVVVIGGDNCEGAMGVETARQFPFVDAILVGESDETLPALVRRVLAGETWGELPGLATACCGDDPPPPAPPVDLDRLPTPDYRDYFALLAASPLADRIAPQILFETARGCWWGEKSHCSFCGLNGAALAFRSKSAGRAAAELRELADQHPDCALIAIDNILDMRYFRDLIPALAGANLRRELFYEVKSNLRRDQLVALRHAGITQIQPGIESFSDQVLNLMRKGVTGLQNIQLLKWCKELGLRPYWSLLWGLPGEDPAAYAQMTELLPRLAHLPPPDAVGTVRLDRFSPNFARAAELGLTNLRPYPAAFHVYPLAPAAVANLAYSFAADPSSGTSASHHALLAAACTAWSKHAEESDLFFADDGRQLVICDLRTMASRPFTILDGVGRDLYLACDAIRGLGQLATLNGGDRQAAGDLLAPLVEEGLILQRGDSYLALAVRLGDYQPHPNVAERAKELAERSLEPTLSAVMATRLAPAAAALTRTGADGRGARSGRYPCVPAASSGDMKGSNLAFSIARK